MVQVKHYNYHTLLVFGYRSVLYLSPTILPHQYYGNLAVCITYVTINTSFNNLTKASISLRHLVNRWWMSNYVLVMDITVINCTGFLIYLEYICLNITSKALTIMCINVIHDFSGKVINSYWYVIPYTTLSIFSFVLM